MVAPNMTFKFFSLCVTANFSIFVLWKKTNLRSGLRRLEMKI